MHGRPVRRAEPGVDAGEEAVGRAAEARAAVLVHAEDGRELLPFQQFRDRVRVLARHGVADEQGVVGRRVPGHGGALGRAVDLRLRRLRAVVHGQDDRGEDKKEQQQPRGDAEHAPPRGHVAGQRLDDPREVPLEPRVAGRAADGDDHERLEEDDEPRVQNPRQLPARHAVAAAVGGVLDDVRRVRLGPRRRVERDDLRGDGEAEHAAAARRPRRRRGPLQSRAAAGLRVARGAQRLAAVVDHDAVQVVDADVGVRAAGAEEGPERRVVRRDAVEDRRRRRRGRRRREDRGVRAVAQDAVERREARRVGRRRDVGREVREPDGDVDDGPVDGQPARDAGEDAEAPGAGAAAAHGAHLDHARQVAVGEHLVDDGRVGRRDVVADEQRIVEAQVRRHSRALAGLGRGDAEQRARDEEEEPHGFHAARRWYAIIVERSETKLRSAVKRD